MSYGDYGILKVFLGQIAAIAEPGTSSGLEHELITVHGELSALFIHTSDVASRVRMSTRRIDLDGDSVDNLLLDGSGQYVPLLHGGAGDD